MRSGDHGSWLSYLTVGIRAFFSANTMSTITVELIITVKTKFTSCRKDQWIHLTTDAAQFSHRSLGLRALNRPGDYLPPARLTALIALLWPDASQNSELARPLNLGQAPHTGTWVTATTAQHLPISSTRLFRRKRSGTWMFRVAWFLQYWPSCLLQLRQKNSASLWKYKLPLIRWACATFLHDLVATGIWWQQCLLCAQLWMWCRMVE